jgi:hypothetical protein
MWVVSKTPAHLDAMVIFNLGAMVPTDGDHSHTVGNVVMKPPTKKKVQFQLGSQKNKKKKKPPVNAVTVVHVDPRLSADLITSKLAKWCESSRYFNGCLPHFDLGNFIEGLVTIANHVDSNAPDIPTPVIWPSFFCLPTKALEAASVMCNTKPTLANVEPTTWQFSDLYLNLPAVYVEDDLEEPTIQCSEALIEMVCTNKTLVPRSLVVATTVLFSKLAMSPTILLTNTTEQAVKASRVFTSAVADLKFPPLVCLFVDPKCKFEAQCFLVATVLQQNGLIVSVQNDDVLKELSKVLCAWDKARINKNSKYSGTGSRHRGGYYLIKESVDGPDMGDSRLPQQCCTVNLKSLTDDEDSEF